MLRSLMLGTGLLWLAAPSSDAQTPRVVHEFQRIHLVDDYFSEGAHAGDLDGDQIPDAVYGPYWFKGPKFTDRAEIYPAKPQPKERYADHFFHWVHDFNGDGFGDVFVVGFPGKPAFVYENPGPTGHKQHWKKHQVFPSVGNEAPHFTQLVGDDRPELVCTLDGQFGFATIDSAQPLGTWAFHKISERPAPKPFGHGLGVGDLNGDGRRDILISSGWFEQPADDPLHQTWPFHPVRFTPNYGGAEMCVTDVDGDGDADVVTSLAAHDFGLAWFEQQKQGAEITFKQHLIMGDRPSQNQYGLVFSELHSVALADMDGDGVNDIITGKTYWSHHAKSPMWDAGAVVYWFQCQRTKAGVEWIPHLIDKTAGIGRQVSVVDVNRDGLLDVVVGGMVGGSVLMHQTRPVSEADWQAAQPVKIPNYDPTPNPPPLPPAAAAFKIKDALEGEDLVVEKTSAGRVSKQNMKNFTKNKQQWSDEKQLFWVAGAVGAKLELSFDVKQAGTVSIQAAFTKARDYGIFDLLLDDQPLQTGLDLFNAAGVITTGAMTLGDRNLAAGAHRLTIIAKGSHPQAAPTLIFGLDYLRLEPK